MKAFKDVEKDRKLYHKSSDINSVNRSSLLVPKISKNKSYISFLNHFLIKRKYNNVSLKITGFNKDGVSGDSISIKIDKPKVYSYCLEELLGDEFNCYQVEFFCSSNLFIPFPAVLINHFSEGNVNIVHSFNRILNDVREMDKISSIKVKEASIDLALSKNRNTFFIFQSGLKNIEKEFITISIKNSRNKDETITEKIPLSLKKMSSLKVDLKPLLSKHINKDISPGEYVLKIEQPSQIMFYGRLLVGVEDLKTGSFSANHSYYDNSEVQEYFQKKKSYKTFPFFDVSKNNLRVYPIMSPGKGTFYVYINYEEEKNEASILHECKFINHKDTLNIDIDNLLSNTKIKRSLIQTYTVIYEADGDNLSPTRINMQLVYGEKNNNISIDSSVNVSLHNDEIFLPKKKYYESWGQLLNKNGYESKIAIYFGNYYENNTYEEAIPIELEIYDQEGIFLKKTIAIKKLQKYVIKSTELDSSSEFVWVVAKSTRSPLNIFTFHTNIETGFSSAEHGF